MSPPSSPPESPPLPASPVLARRSTASAADEAATVNGESIPTDDFEAAVEESGAVDPATGTVDATVARTTLSGLIADTARLQFLDSHGITADAATAAEQLGAAAGP